MGNMDKKAMDATVLITGANGFIGSHTVLLLESLGYRVVPLDVVPRSKELSLLPVKTATQLLDVADFASVNSLCKKEEVTHIIHFAFPSRKEDTEVLSFYLQAMRNILDTAKETGVQRVVFSSSGAVYGQLKKEDHSLIKEDDLVAIYPAYIYRAAKILGEWVGDFYVQHQGISFVALRFSSVYGPGLWRGLGETLKQGILGRECRPFLTRSLDDPIYVADVARAVHLACFCEKPLSRAYNIASDKHYDEEDLARAIRKHLPECSFTIGRNPDRVAAPHRQRGLLDVTLAREELGWVPEYDLDQGIAALVEWLRSVKDQLS